ncbi:MAG: lipid-A-disaccharide synthase [Bacteroidales bacterium]|nr:lipid-A-disaccharide synthase [Bacteroidales bacterium]
MKYYLIAGEASGDLHASNLMKGLVAEDPAAEFRFVGGDLMKAVGGELVRHYKDGAAMGVTDVARKAGKILGALRLTKKDILDWKPDVVILVDYPGFNMRIAKFAHSKGIKVFYYIAPKTWASRESRNRKLKKYVDKLFIVFPFEIPYFEAKGVPFVYKGNPLVDAVDQAQYVDVCDQPYIALLAGSRKGEISRMMPVCMEVADRLHALPEYKDWKIVLAGAPARSTEDYSAWLEGREYVDLVFGQTYSVLHGARAAIINSGTASLEAALIGTPQVVCWSTSRLTAFLARRVFRVMDHIKFISLGNLIMDRLVFRELVQEAFTADEVLAEVRRLIEDEEYRGKMLSGYSEIKEALGGEGASRAVAREMISLLI